MIDLENKYIFVHPRRTGGSAIEMSLNKNIDHIELAATKEYHWYLSTYAEHYNLDDFYIFCTIRNPYDTLVSIYYNRKFLFGPFVEEGFSKHNMPFSEFVESLYIKGWKNTWGINADARIFPYIGEYMDKVDYLIRYENLQKDLNVVCNKLGLSECKLVVGNRGFYNHPELAYHAHRYKYQHYYDKKTKEIAEKLLKKDLEVFGYEY